MIHLVEEFLKSDIVFNYGQRLKLSLWKPTWTAVTTT